MLRCEAQLIPTGDGWILMGSRCIQLYGLNLSYILTCVQWWDAEQQTNRPHGWAFSKISNGIIRDMKLWKVSFTESGQ